MKKLLYLTIAAVIIGCVVGLIFGARFGAPIGIITGTILILIILPRNNNDNNKLYGKWDSNGLTYVFQRNGEFLSYKGGIPDINGKFTVVNNNIELNSYDISSVVGFSIKGNTLYMYPSDGGDPIIYDRI